MNRSESIAYASSNKVQCFRSSSPGFWATTAFLGFVFILSSNIMQPHSGGSHFGYLRSKNKYGVDHFGGAIHPGYFSVDKSVVSPGVFRFAAVTDMDQLSKVTDSKKPLFRSLLLPGILTRNEVSGMYSVELEETRTLTSAHNEAGRGMELSELTLYNDRLLAFDDRTGSVFEILSKNRGMDSYVVPRFVVTEGEGDTDKGMKWEWAAVKDNELYMGSMGKEYTNVDGSVANTNNLWIAILSPTGELRREDWTRQYNFVRAALGASSPGYIITEANLWSSHLKKWLFLPRRISSDKYDENEDERKGSNRMVLVDEKFTQTTVLDIKMSVADSLHGFSTVAFVPGTKDRHAVAIRSVEEDCVGGEEDICKQRSYMIVFETLTGNILMDETRIDSKPGVKYEGLEFVDIYTSEPTFT
eukprot:CAMPEP_0197831716 /NCGR_PEP_ID=MMETSP1437-20131217/11687_1 /TAXON_ID=49252 ORGANISM="Eucampia antarctica, Strain CCMP1452" /NCGR_SAMPLE_ID=MMETSP1437 /ASSEMBLY_ACC=CAM_ASM_001096 /LENGTH=414 /DNA_ID=CAMNT_0043434751 /DNA_START=318 /DNA_END=1562 /DNA_ORIENTATION=+